MGTLPNGIADRSAARRKSNQAQTDRTRAAAIECGALFALAIGAGYGAAYLLLEVGPSSRRPRHHDLHYAA